MELAAGYFQPGDDRGASINMHFALELYRKKCNGWPLWEKCRAARNSNSHDPQFSGLT
jgi:hypothetical protein